MGLIDRLNARLNAIAGVDSRSISLPWSTNGMWPFVTIGGTTYPLSGMQQTISGHIEEIDGSFEGLVQGAYKDNGIVFACMMARMRVFRQARFIYQDVRDPGKLFGDQTLDILEHPWPNGSTADLLARAIQDADLAGNAFFARRSNAIRHLRPDWVDIVLGSPNDASVEGGDIDAEVIGYVYHPGGRHSGREIELLLRQEVAHFAPIPDPVAMFRGMSWLTPVLREIAADKQMVDLKQAYLVNGATPNLTVAIDKDLKEAASPEKFKEWVAAFKKMNQSEASWDKFSTWYLAGGTVVTKVGDSLGEAGVNYKQVQGAGETRIAAAAGVPPVIVGLSEGLQAATYSNYGQARRAFADNTLRDLWQDVATTFETIVPPPNRGSRLWYDDRYIQALAEDKKDLAEVKQLEVQQIASLTREGFTWETAIQAVTTGDWSHLDHTGMFSVQLQPPMPDGPPKPEVPQLPPGDQLKALIAASEARIYRDMLWTREQPQQLAPVVAPPEVHVYTPEVTVNVPETLPPVVNVAASEVTVEPAVVNVKMEPPVVNVEAPSVTIEPPAVTVNVPAPRSVTKTVKRNDKNEITAIVETPDGD